jgi:uncharacterized membrane protein YfcA
MDFSTDLSLAAIAACTVAFFIAGFIDSIAGGGGLITTPSLLIAGLPPHFALGTGKLASSLGSLTALLTFAQGKMVNMKIAPLGFAMAFLGAALGSWIALQIPSATLGRILVVLLPVGLLLSLFCGKVKLSGGDLPTQGLFFRTALIGLTIGCYDGFFGPGAGSFFIITLHLFLKMGLVQASANAKVFNLASNFGALCAFATGGAVLYLVALPCAVASILGNRLGAKYAMKIGPAFVKKVLYFSLSLLFVTLLYRFFIA